MDVLELIEDERSEGAIGFSVAELSSRLRSLLSNRAAGADELLACAKALHAVGAFDLAFQAYGGAIERDGKSCEGFIGRGEVGFAMCLCEDDIESRRTVGTLAVEDFRKGIGRTNGPCLDGLKGLANSLLVLERYGECTEVLTAAEDDPDALFLLAFCYLFSGDGAGAFESQQLLESVDITEGLFVKGVFAVVRGDVVAAAAVVSVLKGRGSALALSLESLQRSGCATFVDVARALLVTS